MTITFNQNTPIYLQVARMIRDAILTGDLSEGEAIPSVRRISVEHSLNPQTVLNATQTLVSQDVLEKRRGLGIFVKEGARQRLLDQELEIFITDEIPALTERARLLGVSTQEIVKLIKQKSKG